jgi:glyoxylase-like metal-dependent hydrolase (beta-lactamase superfamily II)
VYNPGAKSMFPVSSEIVTGQTDAVLIDAQFQRNDAEALVQKIKATGKKLTTVYISHSDPDYYFGLDVIQAAFPDAKIVATPQTVAAIQASKDGKLAHWGPILKDNAPKALVVPAATGRRQPRRSKAARSRSSASTAPRPNAASRGFRR